MKPFGGGREEVILSETPEAPPAPPLPTLAALANFGPRDLLYPPAQTILPGVKSYLNHPFAMTPGYRLLRLDLHLPENVEGPVPVVVYASGGAWLLAIKHHGPWKFLLSQGYAVAAIEYRLSGEATLPLPLHDVKAAVRWLRANAESYGLDAGRIAGWGSSAGGYLMAMAGVTNGMAEFEGAVGDHLDQSSKLACVIDHYGATDLATMAEDTNDLPGVMEMFGTATSPESRLLGFVPAERPDEAARANVANYVTDQTAPFLIMHGDADTRLGVMQSHRLHQALRAVGADAEFHVVPGANHAGPEFDTDAAHAVASAFLRRTLGPGARPHAHAAKGE